MTVKLTLSLDQDKIEKAKRISKKRGKSVSKLFEEFIDQLEKDNEESAFDLYKIIGAFDSASGNLDADEVRWEYLKRKHDLSSRSNR